MKISFHIKQDLNFTFDHLTDMQKFASVHPVISRIENIGDGTYLVHETLKFGFIPFSFTYPITMESNILDKKITIKATVFKLTKIEMKFHLTADHNYTRVDEEITFKSLLPLKFMMQSIFKTQHHKLFKNIELA